MTDLAGETVGAAVQVTVEHQPPADPRAEGDHDDVVAAPRGAQLPLTPRRARGVVVHLHGELQPLLEQRLDLQVAHAGQVGRHGKAPVPVDQSRRSDAERVHGSVGAIGVDDGDDGVEDSRRGVRRRHPPGVADVAGLIEGDGKHLGAAHVDADRARQAPPSETQDGADTSEHVEVGVVMADLEADGLVERLLHGLLHDVVGLLHALGAHGTRRPARGKKVARRAAPPGRLEAV